MFYSASGKGVGERELSTLHTENIVFPKFYAAQVYHGKNASAILFLNAKNLRN